MLFTVFAGTVVHWNTRHQVEASESVHHTEKVIASVQQAALQIERIDYRTRLYLLTQNEEHLNRARTSANQLDTVTEHLKMLVSEADSQNEDIAGLERCSREMNREVLSFDRHSTISESQLQECKKTLGLMLDREQALLQDRNKGSQKLSFQSIVTELAFVLFSLLTLVVLFGVLLRDALRRQKLEKATENTNQQLARTIDALKDRAYESEILTNARDELQLCVDVHQVYLTAANSFSRLLAGTSGTLCILNNSLQLVEVGSSWGDSQVNEPFPPDSCCGLRAGQPRWRQPGISELQCSHFSGNPPERYLCKPILAHGTTLGVLYVQCDSSELIQLVRQRMDGLRQLIQLTGMAIASLNLRTRLESQSIRDPLTGLFNRHFMQISLERELSRAARRHQTLAIYMLDVDHFKKFNDTYGHAAGDLALKTISEIFRTSIRMEDIACRYGGEEFTIMLPDMTQESAFERAETIRRAIENLRIPLHGTTISGFSVSIGVAFYPSDAMTADLLLSRADQALYRAKRSGRNQVTAFESTIALA